MKNAMKLVAGLLLSTGLLAACGDDTNNFGGFGGNGGNGGEGTGATNNGGSGGGTGGEGGGGGTPIVIPPKPELGAQIDRMGRPAVNTALNGAFVMFQQGTGVKIASDDDVRKSLENQYNQDDNQNQWITLWRPLFAANLAFLDALDTGLDTGGGPLTNQAACTNGAGNLGDINDPDTYNTLAGALADDRLWMKVDGELCSSSEPDVAQGYLALEIGLLTQTDPTGCGGRRPVDDVIETTYSATAIGAPIGFDDGIDAPAGLHPETFPYLADPH